MSWVARKKANVDRIACTFVDQHPGLIHVPAEEVSAVAPDEGAIPYDAKDVELGPRGRPLQLRVDHGQLQAGRSRPPATAKIVHGGVAADRGIVPDAVGLYAIAHGLAVLHGGDDQEKIRLETPMYDALYTWCPKQAAQTS